MDEGAVVRSLVLWGDVSVTELASAGEVWWNSIGRPSEGEPFPQLE